jgi:hypothetical protein
VSFRNAIFHRTVFHHARRGDLLFHC